MHFNKDIFPVIRLFHHQNFIILIYLLKDRHQLTDVKFDVKLFIIYINLY